MTDAPVWRYERAAARVRGRVDQIAADFATSYVGRPVQRQEVLPPRPLPGITWSIDGDLVVEFVHRSKGRDELLVHEVALLDAIRRSFRTRHIEVSYVTTAWREEA